MVIMAISSPLRKEVLNLYKRILRIGRTWNATNSGNTKEERKYIFNETRHWFMVNRNVKEPQAIRDHLQEGEARLEMGNIINSSLSLLTYNSLNI